MASEHHNQQIEPVHLLKAMLSEKKGVAGAMLRKLGVSPNAVAQELSLAMEIIQGNLKEGSEIEADMEDEQIVFRPL
jgi:ATP-dependent Clp protease ATP-binding subunit ClpA